MRFSEFAFDNEIDLTVMEDVRADVLYHACYLDSIYAILQSNGLEARTDHMVRHVHHGFRPKDVDQYDKVNGVSLTRDPRFARAWRPEGVVLVLDAAKLRQRYRFQQVDYNGKRKEAEEFLIGPLTNLSAYLVGLQIASETADWCRERDADYDEADQEFPFLLNHPALQIVGQSWDSRTGVVQK